MSREFNILAQSPALLTVDLLTVKHGEFTLNEILGIKRINREVNLNQSYEGMRIELNLELYLKPSLT